jgi:hypothetical protein
MAGWQQSTEEQHSISDACVSVQSNAARVIEYCFEPLLQANCYSGLHCDVPLTASLLHHPAVVSSHITGSLNTHDTIVWGPQVCPLQTQTRVAAFEDRQASRHHLQIWCHVCVTILQAPASSHASPRRTRACSKNSPTLAK